MGKNAKKLDIRGPLQRAADNAALDVEQSAIDVITPELRAKGFCERSNGVYINRGGTPVSRWIAAGKLSDTQALAISFCYRLWARVGVRTGSQTAKYGERIGRGSVASLVEDCEWNEVSEIEAKDDLARIDGYFDGLRPYWQIFENVCRWDEPAGVAGSRLGFGTRSSEDRAHTVVCMVADVIATKEGLSRRVRIRVG